jgi:hypothetical protein
MGRLLWLVLVRLVRFQVSLVAPACLTPEDTGGAALQVESRGHQVAGPVRRWRRNIQDARWAIML